jgi:hypothetical protein
MLLTLLQSANAVNNAQIVGGIDLTAVITANAGKKPGGSGGAYSDFDANLAARIRLARMDQQDLLDIVSILGLIAAQLDEF